MGKRDSAKALLPIREASKLLHLHHSTLRRWSDQGIIKSYRIGPGGHRRFKREDIDAFLKQSTQDS